MKVRARQPIDEAEPWHPPQKPAKVVCDEEWCMTICIATVREKKARGKAAATQPSHLQLSQQGHRDPFSCLFVLFFCIFAKHVGDARHHGGADSGQGNLPSTLRISLKAVCDTFTKKNLHFTTIFPFRLCFVFKRSCSFPVLMGPPTPPPSPKYTHAERERRVGIRI
jgi:hypothetical protein